MSHHGAEAPSPRTYPTSKTQRSASGQSPTASAADRLRQIADAREVATTAWKPEVGDELLGIFRGWSSGVTRRAETHPIALVEDERGVVWAVWAFYKVLRAELETANPHPGELMLIRRLPDRESENGPYRVFRVVVDRPESDPFAEVDPPLDAEPPGDWQLATGQADCDGNASCRDKGRPR